MSVTMHLYRVVDGVRYKGYYMDYLRDKDIEMGDDGKYGFERIEMALGCPDKDKDWDAYEEWLVGMEESAWSDGKIHHRIDLTFLKYLYREYNYRGGSRKLSLLSKFTVQRFNNGHIERKYIVVDEVVNAQGWFFKGRFFRCKLGVYYSDTKEGMERFFENYIDYNGKDKRGREVVKLFKDNWEDLDNLDL